MQFQGNVVCPCAFDSILPRLTMYDVPSETALNISLIGCFYRHSERVIKYTSTLYPGVCMQAVNFHKNFRPWTVGSDLELWESL